jgi:hypothetical protein
MEQSGSDSDQKKMTEQLNGVGHSNVIFEKREGFIQKLLSGKNRRDYNNQKKKSKRNLK